jgi:2-polyprenyl-3-methyl-5-hydroxy-6-metoxy-1,4-benzoquinol methylase
MHALHALNDMKHLDFENFPWPSPPHLREVRAELSNACGYSCFCCPREQHTREVGQMSFRQLEILAERLAFLSEPFALHLHGFGEPMLVHEAPRKIALLKQRLPLARTKLLTTLGYDVDEDYLAAFFSATDELTVSFYGRDREEYCAVHGTDRFELAQRNLNRIVELATATGRQSALCVKMMDSETGGFDPQLKARLDDADIPNYVTGLHNFGSEFRFQQPGSFPCSVGWGFLRDVLQVSWNLNVIPCCFVINDDYVFGNLEKMSVGEIMAAEPYRHFITDHLNNDVDKYPFCAKCQRDHAGSSEQIVAIECHAGSGVPGAERNKEAAVIPSAVLENHIRWRFDERTDGRTLAVWGTGKHSEFLLDVLTPGQLERIAFFIDDHVAERFYRWPIRRPKEAGDIELVLLSSDTALPELLQRATALFSKERLVSLYDDVPATQIAGVKFHRLNADNAWQQWLADNACERMDAVRAWDLFNEDRWQFHLARYRFACGYTEAGVVGDIACGTGYGSEIMFKRGRARKVIGVDLAEDAVAYARAFHADGSIEYLNASGDQTELAGETFDLLTSFETLEHVPDGPALLAEFARLLKPGGILIISTPNEWPLSENPHHCAEYGFESFMSVLEPWFEIEDVFNQNSGGGSPNNHAQPAGIVPTVPENRELAECHIAVCRKRP